MWHFLFKFVLRKHFSSFLVCVPCKCNRCLKHLRCIIPAPLLLLLVDFVPQITAIRLGPPCFANEETLGIGVKDFYWMPFLSPNQQCQSHERILPRAGSGTPASCRLWVERIDPLCFLARCRKRRLNQALSVLSLSTGFFFLLNVFCHVH